jgi:hypothetical protein
MAGVTIDSCAPTLFSVQRRTRKEIVMAKTADGRPKRDSDTGRYVDKNQVFPRVGPEILFPTEPTSIDPKRIDRAIRRVIARKKQ